MDEDVVCKYNVHGRCICYVCTPKRSFANKATIVMRVQQCSHRSHEIMFYTFSFLFTERIR